MAENLQLGFHSFCVSHIFCYRVTLTKKLGFKVDAYYLLFKDYKGHYKKA